MKATITSKGQITIPKTIRDVLKLEDEVEFTIDSRGNVSISKTKIQDDTPFNILELCLESNLNIAILGAVGVGKTTLINNLVQQKRFQNVFLQEPFKELEYMLRDRKVQSLEDWNESSFYFFQKAIEEIDILLIEEINRQENLPTKLFHSSFPTIMTSHFNLESHPYTLEKVLLSQFPVIPDILVFMDKHRIKEIKRSVQIEDTGFSLEKHKRDFVTIYEASKS